MRAYFRLIFAPNDVRVKLLRPVFTVALFLFSTVIIWLIWSESKPIDEIEYHIPGNCEQLLFVHKADELSSKLKSDPNSEQLWPQGKLFSLCKKYLDEITGQSQDNFTLPEILLGINGNDWFILMRSEKGFEDVKTALKQFFPNRDWTYGPEWAQEKEGVLQARVQGGILKLGTSKQLLTLPDKMAFKTHLYRQIDSMGKTSLLSWMKKRSDSTWTSLDLGYKGNALLLNGFMRSDEALPEAKKIEGQGLISRTADNFIYLNIEDSRSLWTLLEEHYKSEDSLDYFNRQISEAEEKMGLSLKEAFTSWPAQRAVFYQYGSGKILRIGHQSITNTTAQLESIIDASQDRQHAGSTVHSIKTKLQAELLFHPRLKMPLQYFTILDEEVVFSNSDETLSGYLVDRSLGKSVDFPSSNPERHFLNRRTSAMVIGDEFVRSFLGNEIAIDIIPAGANKVVLNMIKENERESLINFIAINGQNSANVNAGGEYWSTPMPSPLITKPQFFTNHYSGEREVLIQDASLQLHLISSNGNPLWTRKLDGRLLGNLRYVDIFNNNKYQIMALTEKMLYGFDRKGRDLEGFPIKLSASAQSGLAVFDYDKDHNYRFLIACEDGEILNYDAQGKKVKGWKYKSTDQVIEHLEHFKVGSRDYILSVSSRGSVQLLKRNGKVRKNLSKLNDLSNKGIAVKIKASLDRSKIYYHNNKNEILSYSLAGKSEEIGVLPENPDSVIFEDINSDGKLEFIAVYKESLRLFNSQSEMEWYHSCSVNIDDIAFYKLGKGKLGIGLLSGDDFSLLDRKGKVRPGFPIQSDLLPSIGDSKRNGNMHMINVKADQILVDSPFSSD